MAGGEASSASRPGLGVRLQSAGTLLGVSRLLGSLPTFHHDGDDRLLADLHAPPPLDEAREALAYWRHRLRMLPRYRRAQRREARAMVARWEERVRRAEIARLPWPLQWAYTTARSLRPPRGLVVGVATVFALMAATWAVVLGVVIAALT
jgi:hypothetical protein